jgi:hypothetical protein
MEAEVFLEKVTGNEGYYCLFAVKLDQEYTPQSFYSTRAELLKEARKLDARGYSPYFALGTFIESGSRKADNVNQLKSFFMDIDCGEGRDYPTKKEGLQALQRFCKKVNLPKPLLVDSGRGAHVYWPLSESVSRDDWKPVADHLKKLCSDHGFVIDNSVTADAARVLRIPTTHNHKTDPPAEVGFYSEHVPEPMSLEQFSHCIGFDLIPVPTKIQSQPANAMMEALMGNKQHKFKDIITRESSCAQLVDIVVNQDGCSEPIWRAGLSIAKFCSDGDKAAHKMSKKHPEYSPEETQDKFDKIKGPYLCSHFDEFKPDVCTKCPHWGKIKSPITLGASVREADPEDNVVEVPALDLPNAPTTTYVIPTYPKPYFRGANNGGVYIRTSNEDGDPDEEVIYHNDIYIVNRITDIDLGEVVVIRLHLPQDGVREFTVPLTAITSREEFRKQMSMQGVAITKMDKLMNYMTTWINELQATTKADKARIQFGWTDDTHQAFVVGNQEISSSGVRSNPPSQATAGLFSAFKPKGSLEQWKEMANFYNREGFELHQYIVASAFGSPLMALMPIACSSFHVHSKDTGLGKTTAMYVGASVWGNPKQLVVEAQDTNNSLMLRGEVYKNLPYYIDELTNAKGEQLSNLIYQLSSGRQRNRMSGNSNTERTRGEPWSLLAVSTGNTSVIETISAFKNAPKAEAARMLETKAVKLFDESKTKHLTDAHQANSQNVYGHAGVPYMQHVIQNMGRVIALLQEVQRKVDSGAQLTAQDRHWSVGATVNIAGFLLAREIGLLDYDKEGFFRYAIRLLEENKNSANDLISSTADVLNDFVHEHWGSILKIKSTDDMRKNQGNGMDGLVIPEFDPKVKLVGRYETDVKKLYIIPKVLKAWCAKQQINYSSLIQEFKDKFKGKAMKKFLTKGTPTEMPLTHVFCVDCSSVDLEEDAET